MPNFANMPDPELVNFMLNFITVANTHLTELDYTSTDIIDMTTLKTTLATKIAVQTTAHQAALAATADRREASHNMKADIGYRARSIQVNKNISNALKLQLGLVPADNQPSVTSPLQPTDLVATALSSGTNRLDWNRNGNKPNTQFMIEARIGSATKWSLVDVVTKTKYEHVGQTPGVQVVYRVRARRNDMMSEPSDEAIVYAS